MGVWCIVIISVIIGAKANEHSPSIPPYLLREVRATADSRVLDRMEHLLQRLSAKIVVLEDRVDGLLLVQNEIKKSLENVSEQFKNFSISTTQRITNLEHRLEPSLEDTEVYLMQPDPSNNITFEVFRDLANYHGFGSNWIVFQRRFNGSVNFFRNWIAYKQGFGDLRGEHWLGLDKLHAIVKSRRYELLIELEDFDGVIKYAHYDDFKIGDESEKYVLKSVGNYIGTAGDSFTRSKGFEFSTYDEDNDKRSDNCSRNNKGAWWFTDCGYSHLNGEYLNGKISQMGAGIYWDEFRGWYYSLKSSRMMVRPVA